MWGGGLFYFVGGHVLEGGGDKHQYLYLSESEFHEKEGVKTLWEFTTYGSSFFVNINCVWV